MRNVRYTGRQVWNKQRKDEILLDVNDVARGYETRLRWNDTGQWVWSDTIAQDPLIRVGDFEAAQAIMADAGRARQAGHETRERVRHPYVLRGQVYCGSCGAGRKASTATTMPTAGAVTPRNTPWPVRHSGNVYLREADVLPAIDSWLAVIFAPHRLTQTITEMHAAQAAPATPGPAAPAPDTQATIADCDARLIRYRAALDAGGGPQTIAEWTRQVKAERAAALARDASQIRYQASRRLTEDDVRALISGLGDLHDVIGESEPAGKAAIYEQLGLRSSSSPHRTIWGYGSCPRGDSQLTYMAPFALVTEFVLV